MMNRGFVGRVFVALGICLALLAFGAYQAHATCSNTACPKGGCAEGYWDECETLICSSDEWYTCPGWCQCLLDPITLDSCVCVG